MKIADHIRHSLEACDSRDLDKAMLFACLAVDGTARKMYPQIEKVGERFRRFIVEHFDIIELMHGGLNLQETVFPFKNNKGNVGIKFEDIVYEKFRCNLAHGNELPDGYGVMVKVQDGIQQFMIDIKNQSMTLPESAIYALGLPCVLAPVNADQKIGSNLYHYRDPINHYVVDRWWGNVDCARRIMDFENQVKVKMDFSNVWPSA
ncbi:MAG: hypothetical protein ACYC45_07730 [Acidithiobacillus ferriphilus]|jgi:hypothetical protein|uniref:hypothetical protein n=1 Tax=Acidithiobacillus ferriphilus TaxID=1689834 RepID=UPI001C062F73|nr:hypothetical protein [Acidithiobacillus ferriphilus]MBU2785196.1 hypothetical protein [Acidithiobacillus ferriphilus]UEP59923.1 hypothetical protein K1Y48_04585 [Acidithiobacillus ferriphilus]